MLVAILFMTLPGLTFSVRHKKTTVPIKLRIEYLRQQVQANFKNPHLREGHQNFDNDDQRLLENEQYDYLEEGNLPITPERDDDGHAITDTYYPRLNTPVTTSTPELFVEYKHPVRSDQRITIAKSAFAGFFRRSSSFCELKSPAAEWMHCQDLITPFLKGIRSNFTVTKTLQLIKKDRAITRFFDLIRINVTDLEDDDHAGVIQQISQEQVRLFQWSGNAIQLLLDIFIRGKSHTFSNLKFGIKRWMQNHIRHHPTPEEMLKSAKLFRPPCVTTATIEGPTKSPQERKYQKLKSSS